MIDVFIHYYKKTIIDKEIEYVTDIIHTVGNYTLLIPIIAKQNRFVNSYFQIFLKKQKRLFFELY